jgi:peptide methionine sulfoxide reductase msrA/msrB
MKPVIRNLIGIASLTALVGMVGLVTARQPASPETATVKTLGNTKAPYSLSGHDISPLPRDRVEKLAERLTPEEAKILLRKGTEPAFCGTLLDNKAEGTYVCRLCGLPLFDSDSKFTSGTGWPSFYQPADPAHIRYERDAGFGMVRTEILCQRCDGHLGHVFDDGPQPTGLRFCLNSASLEFVGRDQPVPEMSQPAKTETAYFAGGCFWGVEDRLQQVPGVISAVSGYQGGHVKDPTYKQVCYTDTGHAESVRVIFDPARVSYRELLAWFFKIHDPTQLNRQGPDRGSQYRSAIFASTDAQLEQANTYIAELQATDRYDDRTIVTVVEKAGTFYEAEDYHQDYHAKHGGSCPLPTG